MSEQDYNDNTTDDIYPVAECRACLQILYSDSNLWNIFEPWTPPWDGMENSIAEDLIRLANIQISETDKHSKVICETCYQVLLGACHFTACVRKNDQILLERYPCESHQNLDDKVWPKPIQVDKTIHSSMFQNPMDIEVKQEVLSEDEYATFNGTFDDNKDDIPNLDIKIEPEEIQQSTQVNVNDLRSEAKLAMENLVPAKSKEKYMKVYENFIFWKNEKNAKLFSETVFLAYFSEIAKTKKPSTLWAIYSMLKCTVHIKNGIDLKNYGKLTTFLKRQSSLFKSEKSKILTSENIKQFLLEAPDDIYLATKVALILGVNGACRSVELYNITTKDIKCNNNTAIITMRDNKTKIDRIFVVRGEFLIIVKKYQKLRPADTKSDRFFLSFQNGKCTKQIIGRHKIAKMPKEIATYLKLTNPECYTGHCFRRSSATLLADTTIKRHGGWKSDKVAEGYIGDSVENKTEITNKSHSHPLLNISSISPAIAPEKGDVETHVTNGNTTSELNDLRADVKEEPQSDDDSNPLSSDLPLKSMLEEKLKKELKRKRNCERQRAYYHRQKDLKKTKKKVPKTNAERQREFRLRQAVKSDVDMPLTRRTNPRRVK